MSLDLLSPELGAMLNNPELTQARLTLMIDAPAPELSQDTPLPAAAVVALVLLALVRRMRA